ncbi:hypothetical protein ES703_62688 [subsurface metagenome]
MQLSTQKAVDKETFRKIFIDHWESFKQRYPSYDTMQYNEVVQKMLGCGKELGGYTEYRAPKDIFARAFPVLIVGS